MKAPALCQLCWGKEGVFASRFSWSTVFRSAASCRAVRGASPHPYFRPSRFVSSPVPFLYTDTRSEGKQNKVYGLGWRSHDVSHRRGSPLDRKCLQGKIKLRNKVLLMHARMGIQIYIKTQNGVSLFKSIKQNHCFFLFFLHNLNAEGVGWAP